jgi:D-alanine-D-alanine ligase-like ATP-grasp enzyme
MEIAHMRRVGILRGGVGEDYLHSLERGRELIAHITEHLSSQYKVVDIFVDKDGLWHLGGLPIEPVDICHKVDLVWNVSGHDFSLQVRNFSVPCVGKNSFVHSLENNDDALRSHVKGLGVKMPKRIVLPMYQPDFDGDKETYATRKAKEIHEKFGAPWIIKSFNEDKSMGIHLAKTFPELVSAIEDGVHHQNSILIEEFIAGRVASVHSVRGFRGSDFYTFPLGNAYGNFSNTEKELLAETAKNLHNHIDASHYLKSDIILTPRNQVYLLGISLHPDIKPKSHFSEVVDLVGAKVHQVVEHILGRAE